MDSFRVRVQNLSKSYGTRRVFCNISFDHYQGVLGIAGPNGSGKSTLLQCLAHLKRPSAGIIEWKTADSPAQPEFLKSHLGYAAPYINLYHELSCAENLHFLLKIRGAKTTDEAVDEALQQTSIGKLGAQLFGNLSTGQQQRLRLAAALVHQPRVLFLDEPGSNLDEQGRNLIESLIAEFKEAGKLVVIASNNPDELNLCDRVYSVERECFL